MNAASIISAIDAAIKVANALIQAGKDVQPYINKFKKIFSKEEITQADLDELAALNDAMGAELMKPLPDGE